AAEPLGDERIESPQRRSAGDGRAFTAFPARFFQPDRVLEGVCHTRLADDLQGGLPYSGEPRHAVAQVLAELGGETGKKLVFGPFDGQGRRRRASATPPP